MRRYEHEAAALIRVLIVEDSAVLREFLSRILTSDRSIEVVGTAADGEEALQKVAALRPDVITMDIHMPKLDGFDTTRRIMEQYPTPIVIVSGSTDPKEVATTFRAMEAGALAMLRRPAAIDHPDYQTTAGDIVRTVKLMSEVRVVRRWPRRDGETPVRSAPQVRPRQDVKLVAIGASTGGPPVLQSILAELPRSFPLPILIVQHMAAGFCDGFAEWLSKSTGKPVHIGKHGQAALPGHVYIAPDEMQMKVRRDATILLARDEPLNGLRPSVSYLFRSVAESFGASAVAGLLTGMGRDGADELKLLKERGALTFAQDRETSAVHGMPGEAIRIGAASYVLSPQAIAATLTNIATHSRT